MASDQVLAVSVVATPGDDWNMDQIAQDFVRCARWARDAGAQAIEANLSCPNVCTQEGQLYTSPEASALIASELRHEIRDLPLVLKIGLFDGREQARAFLDAVKDHATALSTVNSVSATITGPDGTPLFGGLSRGIGGECIRERCQQEIVMFRELIEDSGCHLKLIGVGGICSAMDARERLSAGAHHVQLATAAMLDPLIAVRIRKELNTRLFADCGPDTITASGISGSSPRV